MVMGKMIFIAHSQFHNIICGTRNTINLSIIILSRERRAQELPRARRTLLKYFPMSVAPMKYNTIRAYPKLYHKKYEKRYSWLKELNAFCIINDTQGKNFDFKLKKCEVSNCLNLFLNIIKIHGNIPISKIFEVCCNICVQSSIFC